MTTGSKLLLTCSSNGTTQPTWYLHGAEILVAQIRQNRRIYTEISEASTQTAILKIDGIEIRDTARYVCEDGDKQKIVQLYVVAEILTQETKLSQSLRKGSEGKIECVVTTQHPVKPTFVWYKDGERLNVLSPRYNHTSPGVLHVANAGSNDTGTYRCEAFIPSTGMYNYVDIEVDVVTPAWTYRWWFILVTAAAGVFIAVVTLDLCWFISKQKRAWQIRKDRMFAATCHLKDSLGTESEEHLILKGSQTGLFSYGSSSYGEQKFGIEAPWDIGPDMDSQELKIVGSTERDSSTDVHGAADRDSSLDVHTVLISRPPHSEASLTDTDVKVDVSSAMISSVDSSNGIRNSVPHLHLDSPRSSGSTDDGKTTSESSRAYIPATYVTAATVKSPRSPAVYKHSRTGRRTSGNTKMGLYPGKKSIDSTDELEIRESEKAKIKKDNYIMSSVMGSEAWRRKALPSEKRRRSSEKEEEGSWPHLKSLSNLPETALKRAQLVRQDEVTEVPPILLEITQNVPMEDVEDGSPERTLPMSPRATQLKTFLESLDQGRNLPSTHQLQEVGRNRETLEDRPRKIRYSPPPSVFTLSGGNLPLPSPKMTVPQLHEITKITPTRQRSNIFLLSPEKTPVRSKTSLPKLRELSRRSSKARPKSQEEPLLSGTQQPKVEYVRRAVSHQERNQQGTQMETLLDPTYPHFLTAPPSGMDWKFKFDETYL
ncbi:NCAM1 [Branchiostoma lanceolatum]|uniref:NCAM1 protein n=1 Tax=Branchiostoma lanceolatum TaxID=7740 RepID=A0A8K0A842_BRALA|nr:NCAM1 [Branchiostoma lanceolatum]